MSTSRRPHAVEMAQKVTHDLTTCLREGFPDRIRDNREFTFRLKINIRDGLVQLADVEIHVNEHVECELADGEDSASTIRSFERWLLRVLSPRLSNGFHGWIKSEIGMEVKGRQGVGRLVFRKVYGQQSMYDWSYLEGVF